MFVIFLFFFNRYYELCSNNISVFILCSYLLYLVIVLAVVRLIRGKKRFPTKLAIISTFAVVIIIQSICSDLFYNWKNYTIYSTDEFSIVARINESIVGNRCDICICKNGFIMKKVGNPLALPSNYDPIELKHYEIIDYDLYVIIRMKCNKDIDSYEEIKINIK